MIRKILFAGLFCSLVWVSPVMAIQVPGLYEARIPVVDKSGDNRKSAIQSALRIVLIKLTGDRNAAGRSAVTELIRNADRYVLQYRYLEHDESSLDGQAQTELSVLFDEKALNQVLRDYGISVWGTERPAVLVWLVTGDKSGRRILSMEDESGYLNIIDKRARARGISLIYPLLDLEDASHIKTSDIWAGFSEPIIDASRRYQADVIFYGSIEQITPTLWQTRWTAIIEQQPVSWVSQDELPEIVLDEGIDELVDKLADKYASSSTYTREEALTLTVNNIHDLGQYVKVLHYLESLNSVTKVTVKTLEDDRVVFELINLGGLPVIVQAISLGNMLEPVSSMENLEFQLIQR